MTCSEILAALEEAEEQIDSITLLIQEASQTLAQLQELKWHLLLELEGCSEGAAAPAKATEEPDLLPVYQMMAAKYYAKLTARMKAIVSTTK